ncbi:unnamed protein product [Medioppia subpectinata]|uniref:Tetratricopeptide repeat protein 5-like protein n=1 Tax=Medioppia subpectinata TaxID=1979941 RepID=A0A7R9KZ98_9ACAR|nr:unnamed protein product [Medioppia subpectinata]CAG2111436.1 unnamed protein product [Medioppia subpectinata]
MNQNNNPLEIAKQFVDQLYAFRDNYFIDCGNASNVSQPLKSNDSKQIQVNHKLREVLSRLDELSVAYSEWTASDRALYELQRGRALNISDKESDGLEAKEALSRAVKLRPELSEAWNQLGEQFRKRGDYSSALNCFESALKHEMNKISLRNASMVLRQLGTTPEEKNSNLLKSVERAKKALECDVCDGISWYILGNAYLTLFFKSQTKRDESILKLCKAAYLKAYNDEKATNQTDFLFNYATVCHFDLDFERALNCLQRAITIDPEWEEPLDKQTGLTAYLKDMCSMIDKLASLKSRRIKLLIDSLNKDSKLKIYDKKKFVEIKGLEIGTNQSTDLICKEFFACYKTGPVFQHFCLQMRSFRVIDYIAKVFCVEN